MDQRKPLVLVRHNTQVNYEALHEKYVFFGTVMTSAGFVYTGGELGGGGVGAEEPDLQRRKLKSKATLKEKCHQYITFQF